MKQEDRCFVYGQANSINLVLMYACPDAYSAFKYLSVARKLQKIHQMFHTLIHRFFPQLRNHSFFSKDKPVLNIVKKVQPKSGGKKKDHDLEDLEMQVVRYKPQGLDSLCRNTKFSRKELQIMYRGFKQECPSGIVNEDTFKDIYAQFFPQGDSHAYAHFVFNTFDQDRNGCINFEDFVMGLSVLSRGTLQERLQWAFTLYDINGDGLITKDEMLDIVSAIYEMMGRFSEPSTDDSTVRDHVNKVFQKMDANKDGVITIDEFMDTCQKDEHICRGMAIFDTVL